MTHEIKTPFYESASTKSELENWVKSMAVQFKAKNIHWCDGSKDEYNNICELLVKKGTFIKLNQEKRPNSFACFSDPSDVARVEDKTFICSRKNTLCDPFLYGPGWF